jgi:transcriptional regulator with XRE-family HTH domain
VRWEQALAVLFARSNWTQEELAKKEGVSQRHIGRHLCFGRFLNFSPFGLNAETLPNNLTEGRFRSLWELPDKAERNDRIRFVQFLSFGPMGPNPESLPNNLTERRFLNFNPMGLNAENVPNNLTEGRFRQLLEIVRTACRCPWAAPRLSDCSRSWRVLI